MLFVSSADIDIGLLALYSIELEYFNATRLLDEGPSVTQVVRDVTQCDYVAVHGLTLNRGLGLHRHMT